MVLGRQVVSKAPVPQLDHLRARIVERSAAEGSRRQSIGYAPLPAPLPRLIRHDHAHGLHRGLVPLTNEVARALDQEVVNEEPTVLNGSQLRRGRGARMICPVCTQEANTYMST